MAGKNLLVEETSNPESLSGGKNLLIDDTSSTKKTDNKPESYLYPSTKTQLRQAGEFGQGLMLPFLGLAESVPYEPLQKGAANIVEKIQAKPEYVFPGAYGGTRSLGQFISGGALSLLPIGKGMALSKDLSLIPRIASRTAGGAAIAGGTTALTEPVADASRIGEEKSKAGTKAAIIGGILSGGGSILGEVGKGLYSVLKKPAQEIVGGVRSEAEQLSKSALPRTEEKLSKQAERREVNLRKAEETKRLEANNIQDSALSKLSKKINILADDVTNYVREKSQKFIKAEQQTRDLEAIKNIKDPTFNFARNKQKNNQFVASDSNSAPYIDALVKDIKEQISRTPYSQQAVLNKRLEDIIGREIPLNANEMRAAQLRSSITGEPVATTKLEPVNYDQFEHLRRILNDGSFGNIEGVKALDTTRMKNSSSLIVEAMDKFSPGFKNYLRKYEQLSQNINKARDSQLGRQALKDHGIIEDAVLYDVNPQTITNNILNGTEQGAKDLVNLVGGKSPELESVLRGYIRNQMENMSAIQANNFATKMQGFGREFPSIYQDIKDVANVKNNAVRLIHEADLIGKVPKRLAEIRQTTVGENKNFVENNLRAINSAVDENVPRLAENYVTQLVNKKLITPEEYNEVLKNIRTAQQAITDKKELAKNIKTLVGVSVVSTIGYKGYKTLTGGFGLLGD